MAEENEMKPPVKGQGIGIPPAPVPLSEKAGTDIPSAPVGESEAPKPIPEKPIPPASMDAPNPDVMFSGSGGLPTPEPHRDFSPAITHAPDVSISPPLFIKLDKYSDIVKNLQKLKSFSLAMRDALDAVSDIEKELTSGISLAHKALDEFNHAIANLDSKVLRAHGAEGAADTKEIDDYIKNVYGQMERIKKELGSIKDV
jgi:hypothetical protein